MSGGQSAGVPLTEKDQYLSAIKDYSVDFTNFFERRHESNGITVESQNTASLSILRSAMDSTRRKIRFDVSALALGTHDIIIRALTTSGLNYPVKLQITVRAL